MWSISVPTLSVFYHLPDLRLHGGSLRCLQNIPPEDILKARGQNTPAGHSVDCCRMTCGNAVVHTDRYVDARRCVKSCSSSVACQTTFRTLPLYMIIFRNVFLSWIMNAMELEWFHWRVESVRLYNFLQYQCSSRLKTTNGAIFGSRNSGWNSKDYRLFDFPS